MKKIMLTAVFLCDVLILSGQFTHSSFNEDQKKNSRVKTAYLENENAAKKLLKKNSIEINSLKIFIRVFKKEALMEVWAADKNKSVYSLFKTYKICSSSGDLGPKRKAGDGQVPEGFYRVEGFNPASNFYLSLKVNYPNESDRILSNAKKPGGDIFIHGNCVTIGCIPVTDDKIKEVYLLAVEAKNAGQKIIPVHIFPCRMDSSGMKYLLKEYSKQQSLLSFWKNLQQGFDFFEKEKRVPEVTINKTGSYSFKTP